MVESLEMVVLLRRATCNPRAVFTTPFQMACFYQAVTGVHELAIILPTGAYHTGAGGGKRRLVRN